MAVPKRKTSKGKTKTRRNAQKRPVTRANVCSQCGAPKRAHRVCPTCGYYNGRQVVGASSDS